MNLRDLTVKELLQHHTSILEELKRRKIVRTKNNPVGDYTEWLVAKGLGLDLAGNSSSGYDGIDSEGVKIQIKGRRTTPENKSRQLSAIRKYEANEFDHLVAVIFNENFEIIEVRLIPHEVVGCYSKFREHVNAHILVLKGAILDDPRVTDITEKLSR